MRLKSPLLLAALVAACHCPKAAAPSAPTTGFVPPTDEVLLPIPDRRWEPGAPDEGWCGEASIQMAALHYGTWAPQALVNRLGRPSHKDLWEDDLPTALDALGLEYETWKGTAGDGKGELGEFLAWVVAHVRAGRPVIVGAKLYPTQHPDWDVDHLMPVVGFTPKALVFNTNMEPGQSPVAYSALGERSPISFLSPSGRFYGYAVRAGRVEGGAAPVSLRVLGESDAGVELEVRASGLEPGAALVLTRDGLDGGRSVERREAGGGAASIRVTVGAGEAARFSAAPLPAAVGR